MSRNVERTVLPDTPERIADRAESVVSSVREFMEELISHRERHHLRQQDVADRMSVSQPSVAAFERYDANPTLASIERYAIAVGARLHLEASSDLLVRDGWERTGRRHMDTPVEVSMRPRVADAPLTVTVRSGGWGAFVEQRTQSQHG